MAKAKTKVDALEIPTVSFYELKGKAPDVKVGDKVKAVIIGKVKEIGERESYDKKGETVHHVSIERISTKFQKMHEADDMDMDEYAKYREGKKKSKR